LESSFLIRLAKIWQTALVKRGLFLLCLFLLALSDVCQAQDGFGRFGYNRFGIVPGMQVDKEGLKAIFPGSDRLMFQTPLKLWNPVATSAIRQVILCDGGAGRPSKIRLDLSDIGVAMYFPAGISLKVRSTASPFLSWTEGSVTKDVPTPASDWLSVSFADDQPAFVLGFPEEKTSLQISGAYGDWIIKSPPQFKGWVRFALPFGTDALPTTTASALGRLANRCRDEVNLWTAPLAEVSEPTVKEDATGLVVTYQSPRKQTVIPNLFYLAQSGGYPIKILSKFRVLGSGTNEGPVALTTDGVLEVRLPTKIIPTGRGITVGEPFPQSLSEANWSNPLNLVDMAISNTISGRDRELTERTKRTISGYYDSAIASMEPFTKLSTMYDAAGKGLLETSVHALLNQSELISERALPVDDPQLVSLGWRLDPYLGRLGMPSEDSRRVLAIGAIAGSLSRSPKMRMYGAMFQAALSAERGFASWSQRRTKDRSLAKFIEPMIGIRKGLFSLNQVTAPSPILGAWFSTLRCYGETPTWVENAEFGFHLCWKSAEVTPQRVQIDTALAFELKPLLNIKEMLVSTIGTQSLVGFSSNTPGTCVASMTTPGSTIELPLTCLPQSYSEPKL
jgi:hypothetical protein